MANVLKLRFRLRKKAQALPLQRTQNIYYLNENFAVELFYYSLPKRPVYDELYNSLEKTLKFSFTVKLGYNE
jgi:hypothetical protein